MRYPSDAQGAVLACVQTHDADGECVLVVAPPWEASRTGLYLERDHDGRPDRASGGVEYFIEIVADPWLIEANVRLARTTTLTACIRHGWLTMNDGPTITTQRLGVCWTVGAKEYELREVRLTEDGQIALGAWRHRKLTAPPPPIPVLAGREREIVELADRAIRFGFRLVPNDKAAKAEARRLTRAGWVARGWVGASTGTIEPTALGEVEVAPANADLPEVDRNPGVRRAGEPA